MGVHEVHLPEKSIIDERGEQYDGLRNLQCIAALKAVFHQYQPIRTGDNGVFDHCMDMVLIKIGRIATGAFATDNFHDAIGYLELALLAVTKPTSIPGRKPSA